MKHVKEESKQPYFECPDCKKKSYSKSDIEYKYCWMCHEFKDMKNIWSSNLVNLKHMNLDNRTKNYLNKEDAYLAQAKHELDMCIELSQVDNQFQSILEESLIKKIALWMYYEELQRKAHI